MQPDDDNAREIELALHEDDEPEETDPMSPEERRIINEEAKAEEEFIADQEDSVNPMFFEKTEEEEKTENQPSAAAEQQLDGAFGSGGLVEEEPEDPVSNEEELRKEGADIDYTPIDITPAIEPAEETLEEIEQITDQPIADSNPVPAPEAKAPEVTDVATPTGEVVSVSPKPIPAGMPVSSAPAAESKNDVDAKKTAKPKKKKTGLVIAIIAVLLLVAGGGLGFYAYSQHEAPEKIVNDAVDGLLDSTVLGVTANSLTPTSGKHPMIDATVRDSKYSAGESVHVSVAFKDSAIIYLKLSNLKLVLDKVKDEEQKDADTEKTWPLRSDIYNEVFNGIEGKWVSLSTADLDSEKEDEKKYKCIIESLDTFISSSFKKKAAGIYRSNSFLTYDESSSIDEEDGIKQYPVEFSDDNLENYFTAIRETDEYSKFEACFVAPEEENDSEEAVEDIAKDENVEKKEKKESAKKSVKYSAKFGISGWSHELQSMNVVKKTITKDKNGETTGEVSTLVKYNSVANGEIENAKKLKDVLDEVKKNLETAKDSYVKNTSSETCEKIKNSLAQYGYESVDQCLIQTAKAVEKEIELDEIDFADLIFGDLNK